MDAGRLKACDYIHMMGYRQNIAANRRLFSKFSMKTKP